MAEEDHSTNQTAACWIEQLIEGWWPDHFSRPASARDTQAWNIAHAAKEKLKRLFKGVI